MIIRLFIILGLFAGLQWLSAGKSPDTSSKDIFVTVHIDKLQREVPRRFLGLAVEKEQLHSGEFSRTNSSLVHLLENLGEGTLRIGGDSADYTAFAPLQEQLPSECRIKKKRAPTAADVDEMFHFIRQLNWQVIYALNLGCYSPATAAQEAKYVYSVGRQDVLAFEIGNEPDMFVLQGYRAASWDSSAFLEQYHAYRIALQKELPEVRLSGPGVGDYQNGAAWLPKFVTSEPQALAFTSAHFYPMVRTDGLPAGVPFIPESSPVFPTIAHMLNPKVAQLVTTNAFVPQIQAAEAHKFPFRVTEVNSVARAGKSGVSDVFASALWVLDYSFRFLELGAEGINITTDLPQGAAYSAIQVENGIHVARPVYYGMLFFHQAAQGQVAPVELSEIGSTVNFSAYATAGPDHTARVTLINKDAALTVRASIRISGHYRSGKIFRLSAPSLDARSGITFAGATVAADGSWQPKVGEPALQDDLGVFVIIIPPGSAASLTAESGLSKAAAATAN
jgi:hypothetical protein